jgi:outer membrane biosynthesis protein TonB
MYANAGNVGLLPRPTTQPADGITLCVPGAVLAPAPTPHQAAATDAPVFVNDSGSRKRLMRIAGVLIALVSIAFLSIVGMALAVPTVATSVGLGDVVPFIVPGAAAAPPAKAPTAPPAPIHAAKAKTRPAVIAEPKPQPKPTQPQPAQRQPAQPQPVQDEQAPTQHHTHGDTTTHDGTDTHGTTDTHGDTTTDGTTTTTDTTTTDGGTTTTGTTGGTTTGTTGTTTGTTTTTGATGTTTTTGTTGGTATTGDTQADAGQAQADTNTADRN